MAILGVLLGITMCAVAWTINEVRNYRKLITDMHKLIFDTESRIAVLERRRAHLPEVSYGAPTEPEVAKVAKARPISWTQARDAAEAGDSN